MAENKTKIDKQKKDRGGDTAPAFRDWASVSFWDGEP